MKIRVNLLLLVLAIFIMSGCGKVEQVVVKNPDAWNKSQKNEFLEILKNDKYESICNQKPLYESVKISQNSKLMTKLLIAYSKNLANGCINLHQFKIAQRKRNSLKYSSKYVTYLQYIDANLIKMQLQAGLSIEKILKPYVPEYIQFESLINSYNLLKDNNISKKSLYKIRLNIERIKLMKPNLGFTYALVNIPEFKVHIIENNKTSLSMKVIVGKENKQTPIFSANMKYIVLNPTWNVPNSIARNEIIPKMLKDPNYLSKHRLVLRQSYILNSKNINFNPKKARNYVGGKGAVPFKFIQMPSSHNALGRVKFIFPNSNSVYMHDTPVKRLFKRKVRAYSHGCIRLAKPMKMLQFISSNYTNTTQKQVHREYKSLKTNYLSISRRLPVHTVYLTTYVDDKGLLHIYSDIYGYDKIQKLNFNN